MTASVQTIFQDVVRTTSTHRKNVAALLKLHRKQPTAVFLAAFEECLLRILVCGKGSAEAERAIKFIDAYLLALGLLSSPDGGPVDKKSAAFEGQEALVSTLLLPLVLKGMSAALKAVRFRSCQILAALLNNLDEITESQFLLVRNALMDRLRDKEAPVRAHAAIGLCRLLDCVDDADMQHIQDQLVYLLQHDASSDVRKAILWNMAVNDQVAHALAARSRDIDTSVRKLLYTRLSLDSDDLRLLSIPLRNQMLMHGLCDRDAGVREACSKMLSGAWLKQAGDMGKFVSSLDIKNAPTVASTILSALFRCNPTIIFSYKDFEWTRLTPDQAFLLRHYADHLKSSNNEDALDNLVPSLADYVAVLDHYMAAISLVSEDEDASEGFILDQEAVLHQLLALCINLDLSDETGRRRLDALLQTLLVETDLPVEGITHAIRLGLKMSTGKQYLGTLANVLAAVRESHGLAPEPSSGSAGSGARGSIGSHDENLGQQMTWSVEESVATLKCLEILHCTFQLIDIEACNTSVMYTMLERFVFPSSECPVAAISELSLACLAQCSLLDVALASANIDLFLAELSTGGNRTRISFQCLVDILLQFGFHPLEDKQEAITDGLRCFLQSDDEPTLCLAVEGYCKLMLLKRVKDTKALLALVILYHHPSTAHLHGLRQSLSYFFPNYGRLMPLALEEIFFPALLSLLEMAKTAGSAMLAPSLIASQMLEWFGSPSDDQDGVHQRQADMALTCLRCALEDEPPGARKLMCQVLPKLQLPAVIAGPLLSDMLDLVQSLQPQVSDLVSSNALKRSVRSCHFLTAWQGWG
ncbi:nuclear condensing complex subunit [Entophlyctis helioformis]|nr:nuclear condensing complex subunit [Entophlyctis helioformis]